jgi:hypothetical protein
MAEIGLIIGIAGGAAKLSIALYSIASAIGSAGNEVRTFAANSSALAQVLTTLGDALSAKEPAADKARTIAAGLIALCQTILDNSNKLLEKLRPLVELTGNARNQFILRIRWLFEKSKFASHTQSLENLKSTLSLLVGTVNYAVGIASNKPLEIKYEILITLFRSNANISKQGFITNSASEPQVRGAEQQPRISKFLTSLTKRKLLARAKSA